jgi:hypothetical protein
MIAPALAPLGSPQILPTPSKKNRPEPGTWPERLFRLFANPVPPDTLPVEPPLVEPVEPVLPPVEPLEPPIPVLPVAPPLPVAPLPIPEPLLVPPVLPVVPVPPVEPVLPAAVFNEARTLWKFRLLIAALYVPLKNPFVQVAAACARGTPMPMPASSSPPTTKLF